SADLDRRARGEGRRARRSHRRRLDRTLPPDARDALRPRRDLPRERRRARPPRAPLPRARRRRLRRPRGGPGGVAAPQRPARELLPRAGRAAPRLARRPGAGLGRRRAGPRDRWHAGRVHPRDRALPRRARLRIPLADEPRHRPRLRPRRELRARAARARALREGGAPRVPLSAGRRRSVSRITAPALRTGKPVAASSSPLRSEEIPDPRFGESRLVGGTARTLRVSMGRSARDACEARTSRTGDPSAVAGGYGTPRHRGGAR